MTCKFSIGDKVKLLTDGLVYEIIKINSTGHQCKYDIKSVGVDPPYIVHEVNEINLALF